MVAFFGMHSIVAALSAKFQGSGKRLQHSCRLRMIPCTVFAVCLLLEQLIVPFLHVSCPQCSTNSVAKSKTPASYRNCTQQGGSDTKLPVGQLVCLCNSHLLVIGLEAPQAKIVRNERDSRFVTRCERQYHWCKWDYRRQRRSHCRYDC